jgi:RecA/RadA recombinase
MAKKNQSSFSKLSDALDKIAPDGALIDDSPFAKIDEWISTGSYILNAALSGSLFGGLPNRRSLVLAGEEGTGKTYIALSICRKAQEMGYDIIYFDSEGSIDKDFVARLGVDTSKVRLQPVNTIEEFNHIAAQIANSFKEMKENKEELPKIMVVLDSLGNLSSLKEVTDSGEGSDKRDMTKQQQIRKLFRVNGLQFAKYGIPFIINNHVYAAIGSYVPGNVVSGGGGIKYNASIIFELSKKKLDDKEAEQHVKDRNIDAVRVGVTITIKPVKQRFARPIRVELHIPFYKKPNPFVGLEKFVSWESCGIMRGKALTKKEFDKLTEAEQKKCREFESDKGTLYAFPKDTARTLVCKHLKGETPLTDLFTERVFTHDVLVELDNNLIKPTFMLPSVESLDDLTEIGDELELGDDDVEIEEIDLEPSVKHFQD